MEYVKFTKEQKDAIKEVLKNNPDKHNIVSRHFEQMLDYCEKDFFDVIFMFSFGAAQENIGSSQALGGGADCWWRVIEPLIAQGNFKQIKKIIGAYQLVLEIKDHNNPDCPSVISTSYTEKKYEEVKNAISQNGLADKVYYCLSNMLRFLTLKKNGKEWRSSQFFLNLGRMHGMLEAHGISFSWPQALQLIMEGEKCNEAEKEIEKTIASFGMTMPAAEFLNKI